MQTSQQQLSNSATHRKAPNALSRFARAALCGVASWAISLTQFAVADVELLFLPDDGNQGENADYPVRFVIESLPAGTALQFDINWKPSVIASVAPTLTSPSTDHVLDSESIGDNMQRVLIYSLTNADIAIEGLLNLESTLADNTTVELQPFTVSNILLSDANSQPVAISGRELAYLRPLGIDAEFSDDRSSVSIAWQERPDAESYDLYRSSSDTFQSATKIASPADSTYTDENVSRARYYYWTKAVYPGGSSPVSSLADVAPVPGKPSQFAVVGASHPGDVALGWITGVDTDTLEVYRSIGFSLNGADKIADLQAVETAFSDATALSGIPYTYWVRGMNEFGAGEPTSPKQGLVSISDVYEETELRALIAEGGLNLQWQSGEENQYVIAYSNDMKTWQLLPGLIDGDGTQMLWDQIDEAEIGYPAYFQIFAVEQ